MELYRLNVPVVGMKCVSFLFGNSLNLLILGHLGKRKVNAFLLLCRNFLQNVWLQYMICIAVVMQEFPKLLPSGCLPKRAVTCCGCLSKWEGNTSLYCAQTAGTFIILGPA